MATLAVEKHSFGVILRLTDEETFHLGVYDNRSQGAAVAAACARRIQNDPSGLLFVT